MGDIGPFALLALVWWVFSLLGEARRRQQKRPTRPPERRPAAPRAPLPGERPALTDPSQQEGSRLEQILREMERALEGTTQVPAPPSSSRGGWDAGEELEERGSHDEDAQYEVESLERLENFERPEREVVVLGGDQEELQRGRMQYAEVRTHALTKADHARFDKTIRELPAVPAVSLVAATTDRVMRLRQAVLWREVLGQPVALRGEKRF